MFEVDEKWEPLPKEERLDPEEYTLLPEGTYDVWVRFYEGELGLNDPPGRYPADGYYLSNKVRLTVLPDGTEGVREPLIWMDVTGPRFTSRPFVQYGKTRLVWTRHLSALGVRTVAAEDQSRLTLTRLNRKLVLPRLYPLEGWIYSLERVPALRAGEASVEEDYLVPLDAVERQLGIRVK